MDSHESIENYITRVRNIASKSAALGQIFSSREIVYHAVRGIHSKFENIASVLRPQRTLTLEDVQLALCEEERRKNSRGETSQNSEQAYRAKERRYGQKSQTGNKLCYVCRKSGHLAKDCWYKSSDRKYRTENRFQGRRKFSRRGEDRQGERANVTFGRSLENSFAANTIITSKKNFGTEYWNLDSGCSSHMTPKKNWMVDVQPYYCEIKLAEEGRSVQAKAKGNVKITTYVNSVKKNICVYDVLYVPNLRTNLLSVSSLIKRGNSITFGKNGAKIYNQNNDLIAEANEKNKMFVLKSEPRNEFLGNFDHCFEAESKEQKSEKYLWHRRLGHLNETYLDRMSRDQMVRGLNYKPEKLDQCEPCILGKLVQNPFPKIIDKTSKQLELVHMDLCGPMPCKSLSGARYMYVLVDSYSRRIFVYFLRTKDEAYEKFMQFKNLRENEMNCKIQNVRSDNGTEFTNDRFQEMFKNEGIRHQRTVTYTPQSNGTAERANRTLLDMARTMLIDSELPLEFWAEAVAVAAYLKNCTPTRDGGSQTPIEKWSGSMPSVNHVKVFGCTAYFHIPKNLRSKLSSKARKGIFVGYSRKRRAYRILDPADRKIHEVRTAKFDENSKGSSLLKSAKKSEIEKLQYELSDVDLVLAKKIATTVEEAKERKEDVLSELPNEKEDEEIEEKADDNEPIEEVIPRRSDRLKTKSEQANFSRENHLPKTYSEAIQSPDASLWKAAMDNEIKSLRYHKVWTLKTRTKGMKILKGKWIFTMKEDPEENVTKRKARFVAMGHNQRPGVDYEESYSPVMKLESLRSILAISSHLKLKIRQIDIKTAYLYGEMKEKIYVEQPEGYTEDPSKDEICELKKSLYGLPQSGRYWNEKFNEILSKIGMKRINCDSCIYHYKREEKILIMGIYVDDCFIAGTDNDIIDDILQKLKGYVEISENKGTGCFLGIEIFETSKGIELSQKNYIDKILVKHGLADCKPVKSPGDPCQKLEDFEDSPKTDLHHYQELLGSLMYLSTGTRPDITYSVSNLSQYNQDPRQIHLTAVKRVYRYLKGTKGYKLIYDRKEGKLEASTDASWCSNSEAKSFSGYTLKLGNSLVSWKTRKQKLVALSTCESELIALCEGVCEMKYVSNILQELDQTSYLKKPIIVNTDSKSAIDWVNGQGIHSRTKHINRKYYFIRDEVKEGNLKLQHVKSEDMDADILTKNLSGSKLEENVKRLGLKN